jgi:hypothetical protein
MKKYLFLLTLFGCLMVVSCTKEISPTYEATVKGRVLEADSDVGVPNMTVKLVEDDYTGTIATPKRTTLQSVKTDASGNYKFSYTGKHTNSYDVVAVNASPDYNEYTQSVLIPDGASNVVDIFLSPFGWLKIRIKNINPIGEEDALEFQYGTFVGTKVDTSIIAKDVGSRKYPLKIGVKTRKNGVETSKIISVLMIPHDTTKLDIFY